MGFVRHWNGAGDALYIYPSYTTYPAFSGLIWVKRDAAGATRNALAGRLYSSTNGWAWYIDASNNLCFQHDQWIDSTPCPDIVSQWAAIAVVYNGTNTKFYHGTTVANFALIATISSPHGGFLELGGGPTAFVLGNISQGNLISVDAWNGYMDHAGIVATAQTIEQLKTAMVCGNRLGEESGIKFYADITGANPEPCIFDSIAHDLTVLGTTVEEGDPIGCDFAGGEAEPDPPIVDADIVEVSEIIRQIEYLELADLLNQTCSLIPRLRIRRLDDLVQVMELTGFEFFRYTKQWQGIGEFELTINGQSSKAREMLELGIIGNVGSPSSINNFILECSYDGVSDFSGIIDYPWVEWAQDGTEMIHLIGPDLSRWLADRAVVPATGDEFDSYADVQETIIKSLVDRHLINSLSPDASWGFNESQRNIDYLLNATDLLRGDATTFEGRGQSLFSAISEVANFANEFGFGFYIQNDTVIFDIFDGEDRTETVVFDIALGNVSQFKIEWDGMNYASHALLAGQGDGAARTMRTSFDDPVKVGPRRREIFQDARDLDTGAKLTDRGGSVIRDRSRILRLSANKLMNRGPCYKDDFNLGDIVTVRNHKYSVSQSVKIYEVQVIHQAHQAPQVLLTWNIPTAPSALKLIRDDIAPSTSRT